MLSRTDYYIGALVGFFTGVFAVPAAINLGVKSYAVLFLLPLVVPILLGFGVWLGGVLSRWLPLMAQFGKFAAVGFLNTAIDFGVLNLLSLTTGITSGYIVGGVNVPGFLAAATNSYFWNKFWVFKKSGEGGVWHDFPRFIAVTVAGVLVNGGAVILLTTFVSPPLGMDGVRWLNVSKVFATVVTLIWNFFGYKFLVFRSRG